MTDIIKHIKGIQQQTDNNLQKLDSFPTLEDELFTALSLYWSKAANILKGSGINLLDPSDDFFSLEKNFFSALFLYSYHRAKIPKQRRIFYSAINQCIRGLVTGCDNILDDEYKKTLETDLPENGIRFRSVLDILVSDRVLLEILINGYQDNEYNIEKVSEASIATLRALTKSGAQEASEEGGIHKILPPDQVLQMIHHYKTGLLFQCPWAVPSIIESCEKETVSLLLDALYQIGMGCQIMDDMVDLSMDMQKKHHNYVVSLIYYDSGSDDWRRLKSLIRSNPGLEEDKNLLLEFPYTKSVAVKSARTFLIKGLSTLFDHNNQFLVKPAVSFLSKRIGADAMMSDIDICRSNT
jgi:hypothetical protein